MSAKNFQPKPLPWFAATLVEARRTMLTCRWLLLFTAFLLPVTVRAAEKLSISVDPPMVRLEGADACQSLLVHGKLTDGRTVDLTGAAKFQCDHPAISTVNTNGIVEAVADGATNIVVTIRGQRLQVPVEVKGAKSARRFHFENDIIPILSRHGCNSSGCHGKAEGQNGFKLSVFGFDPAADHVALTQESRGRRVFPASPDHSLLLEKVSGKSAHGGGLRIPRASTDFRTLRGWIATGAPWGDVDTPKLAGIRLEPNERQLDMADANGFAEQQLRVTAQYADGRMIDVTRHAKFQSNNDALATVSSTGRVTAGRSPGDVAIMASFMNEVAVFRAFIPRSEKIAQYPNITANNFIDTLVSQKRQRLQIVPSELCDDADYLRRVYLDVIGTLPTAAEARCFLSDKRPDRRARLVDELLQREEFADFWALKWADLLRVDRQALGHKRAYSYYQWIRRSIAENKPLDQFARELVTAEGPLGEVGPANFYKVVNKPGEAASTLSQVLLGVRIACAECHHHPFDRWSQTDYFGMTAFFTPLSVKTLGRVEALMSGDAPPTKHPKTGETIPPHALAQSATTLASSEDRRVHLADWLTAPENPWFARNLANRIWAHFMGRGLVEPVDDVRATNPPTNPELLDALALELTKSKFDTRQLMRIITASRTYQLSSRPNATNEIDEQNYSRARFKRLDAEVLLDMVCQTTGVPEKFDGVPAGSRAIQLWDSKTPHYFLKLFGRPVRASACECERNHEPGVAQVLHFLNSPEIQAKISHEGGTVAKLVRRTPDDGQLVEELYLAFFSRFPSEKEKTGGIAYLRRDPKNRRQAAEDLAWSLLNSLEFGFNH